jgi:hypothetical protein
MLEDGSEARSLIWLLEREDDRRSSVVLAWAGTAVTSLPPFSTPPHQIARVHVWLYRQTLSQLGLAEGELDLRSDLDEACRRQGNEVALVEPLPTPSSAWFVELPDQRTWEASDTDRIETLARLRFERRMSNPCVGFEPRDGGFVQECPAGAACSFRATFAVRTDEGALVGRTRYRGAERLGEMFLVDESGSPVLVRTDTSSPAEAAVVVDGDILLLRDHGELTCMRLDATPCRLNVPPPLPPAAHEFAAMAESDGVIFVARDDGKIWRFDGTRWSELPMERSEPCVPEIECGGPVMNGCDLSCRPNVVARGREALLVLPYLNAVQHLERDQLVLDALPPDEQATDDRAQAIAFGRVRAAVGTSRGRLLVETEPDSWRHLHTSGRQTLFAVGPLDEGFLFAGENQVIDQWHPTYEMCAPIGFGFFTRITDVVPIDLDYFVIGSRDGNFDRDFVWLSRTDEPGDPCNLTLPIEVDP